MSPAKPVKERIRRPRDKKETAKPANFSPAGGRGASRESSSALRLADAVYALSAHDTHELPAPGRPEIAFAGRSNAGKSSAINTLAGRKRLAFASKTPGRTQLLNFFSVGDRAYLVDLPGYGYAGVPAPVRAHWRTLVGNYVGGRPSLAGIVVVMDARHPLGPLDLELLQFLAPSERRVHVLLTKADKLSKQAAQTTLARSRSALLKIYPGASIQLFSSLKREGISQAAEIITGWAQTADNKSPG